VALTFIAKEMMEIVLKDVKLVQRNELMVTHNILILSMKSNHSKEQCVMKDNFKISIRLFEELVVNGTYAIRTMQSNQVGIPHKFKNTREFNCAPQGTLAWSMHESCSIASVIQKNKWAIVWLLRHALLIDFSCQPITCVLCRDDATR
jgi:hypothetical protein